MNSGFGKEEILLALRHLITRVYVVCLFVLFNTGTSLGLFLDSLYSLSSKVGTPESLSDGWPRLGHGLTGADTDSLSSRSVLAL